MSAEYEANRNVARKNDIMEKTLSDSSNDDSLEDLAGSANNSIIGKVKSRVSSIIPSSLSKWFSPSSRNNDSLNGSLSVGTARRRRRLEIDDDEFVDGNETNEDGVLAHSEYKENVSGRSGNVKDSDEDDTDNNSEDDLPRDAGVSSQRAHFTTKTYGSVSQPPSKRSRISSDVTNVNLPLEASTPAVGIMHRNIPNHLSSLEDKLPKPSTSHSLRHYTEANAYYQRKVEQPTSYSYLSATATDDKAQENIANRSQLLDNISSRRTLHLPSSSQVASERGMGLSSLKRQSLSRDLNKHIVETTALNTSKTILEDEDGRRISQDDQFDAKKRHNFNGNSLSVVGNKKQRFNGTNEPEESNVDADSVSESSEGCIGTISDLPNNVSLKQRKTGLFNMSNLQSQNGNNSRTSSFGNGINFFSHLEGRKSLFSGGTHAGDQSNALNNSTLSLTSLNRRQFNASIYGSTSALSDSRLLNTFSPFYKGKTTYGGAAAYKKYSAAAGTSRVCNITPTIIRPTSSLSTLSSSNNSLAATTGGNNTLGGLGSTGTENTSAISSTAKRILDLINDFATPLSEAKKMANSNIKANTQILPLAKARLNESDLQTSRAIRLSQVRTPYTRPAVTLQPTARNTTLPPPIRELQVPSMSQLLQMKKMQSTTERSRQIAMQNSGSAKRSIVGCSEYTLPVAIEGNVEGKEYTQECPQQQTQHTNKIKSKLRTTARITASNKLEDDELPPPINLPNIAFPQMQSVPTFDIALPKQNVAQSVTVKHDFPKIGSFTKSIAAVEVSSVNSNSILTNNTTTTFGMGSSKIDTVEQGKNTKININSKEKDTTSIVTETKMNFKFSVPLAIAGIATDTSSQKIVLTACKNYKFSPPAALNFGVSGTGASTPIQPKMQSSDTTTAPQLKSGSVLDALKNPITLPTTTKDIGTTAKDSEVEIGFGDQFKKSAGNKWECETCLIHNECTLDKCVACETPRPTSKQIQSVEKNPATSLTAGASTFGGQFKKPSDQWECEVCMIRNKEQVDKCVACETPRKGATASTALSVNSNPSNSWKPNSFGDAFRAKPNTWECPSCLINNKSECKECVACQTKNPIGGSGGCNSSGDATTTKKGITFQFGFSSATNTTTTAASADTGFKSLAAAQMSAKWECEACMTRNDAARNKCVCCEQAKPGTTTPDVPSNGPKFTFGSTASNQFTFGFGATAAGASATKSSVTTTSVAISNQKTDGGSTKGFVFGNTQTTANSSTSVGGSGFSFGLQPGSAAIEINASNKSSESKDLTDKGNSSKAAAITEEKNSGFKFGTGISSANKDLVTTTATAGLKFGIQSSTDTMTTTTPTSPAVKFSLATSDLVKSDASTTPDKNTTTGSFTFGSNSITNSTKSQPSTSGFSFGVPAKTTGGETSTTTTATTKTTAFSFGSTVSNQGSQTGKTSSTVMSTAAVKPMFSFGSSSTSITTTTASTSASTSNSSSSITATAFSNSPGGFSFGNSISGAATASPTAKSLFSNFVAPATTASVAASAFTSVPAATMPKLSATPTNVFGTFGENASSANTTKSTTSAPAPTLASTNLPPATNPNVFGVAPSASGDSKPTASATMIFGGASSNGATTGNKATGVAQSAQFVFGSSTSNAITPGSNTATSGGLVAPATSWPKGGFAFGASPGQSNTNETAKPVFGSFMNVATPATAASTLASATGAGNSVFGSIGGAGSATSGASATFGSVAANASTINPATIFGPSASTAPTQPTPNLFGSVATQSTFSVSPPSFGSGSGNVANNTSGFGGAATPAATFGSFGSMASSNTGGDGASAPKKSEPAFNFGGSTLQTGSSGGFNFGAQASTSAKPAFNFSAANVPTFNFTGSSGDAAKPFQFGATPSAPVFNFSGGAVEATPNAPFQFNAGSAPASSNIFAPTPAAPNAPGAMQTRRKIRQPTRRLTPR